MILSNRGETLLTATGTFSVGDRVIATESDYSGLKGYITEIRTGADKETENETVDVYCCFESPESKEEIKVLEERFSALYGEEKHIEDLPLDCVIMAPDELKGVVA